MTSRSWKRLSNSNFPVIYSKFFAPNIDESNKLVEYSIVDISNERYKEACDFMVKHFIPYEPKLVSRNAKDDPLVVKDYYNRYLYGIKQKVSVACIKNGSDDFVAVNILEVYGRNDSKINFLPQSKTCFDIMEAVDYMESEADLFNRHNVDYYLSGTGLAIDPQYRMRGIATEMIKARIPMLYYYDLKLTSTGFASIGAQKAAAKAGSICDYEISYKDLARIRPNWNFLGTGTESYMQMSLKI